MSSLRAGHCTDANVFISLLGRSIKTPPLPTLAGHRRTYKPLPMAVEFIYVRRDHYLVVVPVSGYVVQAKLTSHYTANWTIAVQIPGLDSIHRELKTLST